MKTRISILLNPVFIIGAILIILNSCKDNDADDVIPTVPRLITSPITYITETTASSGGIINSAGSTAITSRGICWSSVDTPTIADNKAIDTTSKDTFICNLSGLTANTTYYVRAYATNAVGTSYGNVLSFITLAKLFIAGSGVTDADGITYKTIVISTQEWMAENLKTTKFNDGSTIPLVTINTNWQQLSTPGYCWYNNDEATFKNNLGALYNWYAVNTAKLCPTGWHIPSNEEWLTLVTNLGGDSMVGGRMKVIGTDQWKSPNSGADNRSGFSAQPAGNRDGKGEFSNFSINARWWSSTETSTVSSWFRSLHYSNAAAQKGFNNKTVGYSVRCVKN